MFYLLAVFSMRKSSEIPGGERKSSEIPGGERKSSEIPGGERKSSDIQPRKGIGKRRVF